MDSPHFYIFFFGVASYFILLQKMVNLPTCPESIGSNFWICYRRYSLFGTAIAFGAFGFKKMRTLGWLAAQLVNVLYWYWRTVATVKDLSTGTISPGTLFFLPFALFTFWAARFLWIKRQMFFYPEPAAS